MPETGCVSKCEHHAVLEDVFYRTEIGYSLHLSADFFFFLIYFLYAAGSFWLLRIKHHQQDGLSDVPLSVENEIFPVV